jgi:hypothetical protein
MAVNANEDQWVLKETEECSGVIFCHRENYGKACMDFGTRSGTIILGARVRLIANDEQLPHGCTSVQGVP